MDRLSMASALVARAKQHKEWIGDDHGDRYEIAMESGVIPDEMQIVVKELLDHLRAALDYCAQQVWQYFSGQPSGAKVYFPITREGFKETDFAPLMNRQMPGVGAASSKAYQVFRGFQPFADSRYAWLPDLATLVNQTKHDHLEVASMPETILNISRGEDGVTLMSFAPGHGPKRGRSPWMMLKADDTVLESGGACPVVYLHLKDIRMELSAFHEDYEDCPAGTTVGYSSRGGDISSRSEPDQCIETVNICRPLGQRNGSTRSGGLTINRNLGGDGDSCIKQIATPRPRRADPYYFDIPDDEGVKERFWFNLNH